MGTDFFLQVKCTIFWLNIGLRVYLDLYVPDFPKSTSKYFWPKKMEKWKNTFVIRVWKSVNDQAAQNYYFKKK